MEITPKFIEEELRKLEENEGFSTQNVRWIVETGSDWIGDPAVSKRDPVP